MSALKFLVYIMFFIVIFFGLLYFRFGQDTIPILQNLITGVLPQEGPPASYQASGQQTQTTSPSIAGLHPLLFPNMRWGAMPIKIFVDNTSCTQDVYGNLREAAGDWQNATTGTLSFSFTSNQNDASVYVQCGSQLPRQKEGRIIIETLGETRPTVINTGLYNLTVSADVAFLLHSAKCIQPVVYLHELGHVLGLAHDDNQQSIMYQYEECDQQITPDIVTTIKQLYKDPALPDLYFTNATASLHGRYADFNVTIFNRGLIESPTTTAAIMDGTYQIYSLNVPNLEPGTGWYFIISNVLKRSDFTNVSIVIDPKNEITEINKQNNIAFLVKQ